jgi:hypothetical protein
MVRILRYGSNRLALPDDGWVPVLDLEKSLHIPEGSVMRIAQSSMRRYGQPRFLIRDGFVRANGYRGQVQFGRPLATKVEKRDLELRSDTSLENGDDAFFDPDFDTDNSTQKALCLGMEHFVKARFLVHPRVSRNWIEQWFAYNLQQPKGNTRINYLKKYHYDGQDYDEIAVWWNQDLGKLINFMNVNMQEALNDDIMTDWEDKGVRQPEIADVAQHIEMTQ